MSIRGKEIYVSTEVGRMLWILSKVETFSGDSSKSTTPDEIADIMLRQAIREQYPQLPEHLASIDKLEKEIIKSISKTP